MFGVYVRERAIFWLVVQCRNCSCLYIFVCFVFPTVYRLPASRFGCSCRGMTNNSPLPATNLNSLNCTPTIARCVVQNCLSPLRLSPVSFSNVTICCKYNNGGNTSSSGGYSYLFIYLFPFWFFCNIFLLLSFFSNATLLRSVCLSFIRAWCLVFCWNKAREGKGYPSLSNGDIINYAFSSSNRISARLESRTNNAAQHAWHYW